MSEWIQWVNVFNWRHVLNETVSIDNSMAIFCWLSTRIFRLIWFRQFFFPRTDCYSTLSLIWFEIRQSSVLEQIRDEMMFSNCKRLANRKFKQYHPQNFLKVRRKWLKHRDEPGKCVFLVVVDPWWSRCLSFIFEQYFIYSIDPSYDLWPVCFWLMSLKVLNITDTI